MWTKHPPARSCRLACPQNLLHPVVPENPTNKGGKAQIWWCLVFTLRGLDQVWMITGHKMVCNKTQSCFRLNNIWMD